MISLLRGKIAEKSEGKIVIDNNGVGYGVTVPLSTYYRLPETGLDVELKIYTYMKDGAIELFGFLTGDEKNIFSMLIGVSGVGPKAATNILSNVSAAELISSISKGDLTVKKVPGIGPKLASRLVTELKDKVSKIQLSASGVEKRTDVLDDIISALINLGYRKNEIEENMTYIKSVTGKDIDFESSLRGALKVMKKT